MKDLDLLQNPVGPLALVVATIALYTDTKRGLFLSSTSELSPESAGSDIRFVRELGQAYYFRTWRNVVFASAARLGIVTPLGDQELIPSVKFFAGAFPRFGWLRDGGGDGRVGAARARPAVGSVQRGAALARVPGA